MNIVEKDDPYKLELDMIQTDSAEILGAEPERNRWGVMVGYRIRRRGGTVTMSGRIACDDVIKHRAGTFPENVPTHTGCPLNGCAHIFHQDPVHPDGLILLPYGLMLCKVCLNLMERKKFRYNDIRMFCRDCVEVQALFYKDINPELFRDLRKEKA